MRCVVMRGTESEGENAATQILPSTVAIGLRGQLQAIANAKALFSPHIVPVPCYGLVLLAVYCVFIV